MPLTAGTEVEVTGVSGSGDYAPIVQKSQVRVLGQSHVPSKAPAMTTTQLLTGPEDGQWVEVEGLVHAVRMRAQNVILDIATLSGPVSATTLREQDKDYARLVDSLIRLHANSAPVFNRHRQLVGVHLFFPGLDEVKVIQAAPPDPFALPVVPIRDLSGFRRTSNIATAFTCRERSRCSGRGKSCACRKPSTGSACKPRNQPRST